MTDVVFGILIISLFSVPISIMALFLLFAAAQPNLRTEPDGVYESSYQPMVMLLERQSEEAVLLHPNSKVGPRAA